MLKTQVNAFISGLWHPQNSRKPELEELGCQDGEELSDSHPHASLSAQVVVSGGGTRQGLHTEPHSQLYCFVSVLLLFVCFM